MNKYENISTQPSKYTRSKKDPLELPVENLSEAEIARKSTSDRTKRRVAHVARFPLPVIKKPIAVAAKPEKNAYKPVHYYIQCSDNSNVECRAKSKSANKRTAAQSASQTRTRTREIGVSAEKNKRKSGDLNLDGGETNGTPRKKQKKSASSAGQRWI